MKHLGLLILACAALLTACSGKQNNVLGETVVQAVPTTTSETMPDSTTVPPSTSSQPPTIDKDTFKSDLLMTLRARLGVAEENLECVADSLIDVLSSDRLAEMSEPVFMQTDVVRWDGWLSTKLHEDEHEPFIRAATGCFDARREELAPPAAEIVEGLDRECAGTSLQDKQLREAHIRYSFFRSIPEENVPLAMLRTPCVATALRGLWANDLMEDGASRPSAACVSRRFLETFSARDMHTSESEWRLVREEMTAAYSDCLTHDEAHWLGLPH